MASGNENRWEIAENTEVQTLLPRIDLLELEERHSLVTLEVSVAAWPICRKVLARLRSAGLPVLIQIQRRDWQCELEELTFLFGELRNCDQLTLQNLLELAHDLIPAESLQLLHNESRIEIKSFQEWVVASEDPRVHLYPVLPWRSFIRKVIQENFEFSRSLLDLHFMYGPDTGTSPELKRLIEQFLNSKKKVLCIFPKKWGGRSQ
ncbi:MAG: hypothetical protein HYZ71_10255 [Deltaproteobacteria bacterium]|nr:hypothetical protein [Deltaproteobacteria bacterium]